jgi:uncharacterized protein YggU (UPF0235/DUF167 family)
MCVAFFAKLLKLPKSAFEIVSGQSSRTKGVMIQVPDEKMNRNERRRIIQLFSSYSQKKA